MALEKEPLTNPEEPNEEVELVSEVEESTIFTKKQEEQPKKQSTGKQKRTRLLALLILVAVLIACSLLAVFYLVPADKEETETSSTPTVNALKDVALEDMQKVVVKNKEGTMVFTSKKVQTVDDVTSEKTTKTEWTLQGYDKKLMAESSVNAAVDSVANLNAMREMEDLSLDYGLDKPVVTVSITLYDKTEYQVFVGDMSPDSSGYYVRLSDSKKVYLVAAGSVLNFDTTPEKMANTSIVPVTVLDENTKTADKKYYDDEGNLSTFDSIVLNGKKYSQKATILPQEESEMAPYLLDLGSYRRYADEETVNEMFGIAVDGLVAIDTYQLNPSSADIRKYGLNKPEADITIRYGSTTIGLKATLYDKDQDYYAVMIAGRDAIYAVTADALSMLSYSLEDFHNPLVFLEYVKDFRTIAIHTPKQEYHFQLSYDEVDEELTVSEHGAPVDEELFTSYYEHLVSLQPVAQKSYLGGKADFKAVLTYAEGGKGKRTIELIKQTDRRYLVKLDGIEMGLVNSTVYDHLVQYVQYVMDEKGIPQP